MECENLNDLQYPIVVFIPDHHNLMEHGYLCGEVVLDAKLKTKNYFVHSVSEDLICIPDDVIGVIGNIILSKKRKKMGDWIKLRIHEDVPLVVDLTSDHIKINRGDYQVIVYDQSRFMKSELLLSSPDCGTNSCEDFADDHFKHLVNSLKHKETHHKGSNGLQPIIKLILVKFISILKLMEKVSNKLKFILKFSTLAIHISMFIQNAIWALEVIKCRNSFTALKSGNYILRIFGDWMGGLLLIYWFFNSMSVEEAFQLMANQSKDVVESLVSMVHYLMGSPADLKLNGPLNNVLGKFFLFHIDLWWSFLGYSRPLLELGFRTFVCLGSLGLSFQVAILADLLAVASFHVYIIYVYAARLYNAQVMGLASLSRVFLGRKRNPLPGRVDSCPYSTEQLLIGTIAFTVLLFLLPTTLVYYVVFTAIRLVLIGVGGLLTQARFVLSALPIYSSLLWLLNSPTTTSIVRLTPKMTTPEQFVLLAMPVQSCWWQTVKACTPTHLRPPPPVHWGRLFWDLTTGRLIYPV